MFGPSIYLIKSPKGMWWSKWNVLDGEKQTMVKEFEVCDELLELLDQQDYIPKEKNEL